MRGKMNSIDLEIDSLSLMLEDMEKNDPFKSRVSCQNVTDRRDGWFAELRQ